MKIELTKEWSVEHGNYFYHIRNNGNTINVFVNKQEAENYYDKYVKSLHEPKIEPEILKSVEL